MKKIIVTTTINPPTAAIQAYDALPDWQLIVVGDLKTPIGYTLERGQYLSPYDQQRLDSRLSALIGWNCIQRRNMGFLAAWRQGADLIATVDDDNIPYSHWGQQLYLGREFPCVHFDTSLPAFDPLSVTRHHDLWHRGYPLQWVRARDPVAQAPQPVCADVQANLWDGDPDVDAVCRMLYAPECAFGREGFPFASAKPAPFNSQNTIVTRRALPDYFMWPGVGRMDDIWAAYYMQARGHRVVFDEPTVCQQRNDHNLLTDLSKEVKGYLCTHELLAALHNDPQTIREFVPINAWIAFERYQTLLQ